MSDDRGVVQQHDPVLAARDRLEAELERSDLVARLPVELAQERLAEVGDLGAGESPDEALAADNPDVEAACLDHGVGAIEDEDACFSEDLLQLDAAAGVVVVIAEHGDHRHLQVSAGIGQHERLLRLALCRQVARKQDQVDLGLYFAEGAIDPIAQMLRAVEIARCREADRRLVHRVQVPRFEVQRTPPRVRRRGGLHTQ